MTQHVSKRCQTPFFAWLALLCACCISAHAVETVCPTLQIEGELDPPLSDAEKRLVCGDPKPMPGGSDAWRKIPPAQARFHLRAFLQSRGYLHPQFVEKGEGNLLIPGEPTRAQSLTALNAPPELRPERRRKVIGEKLTPELLTSLEQWAYRRLQAEGFPCPEVTSSGNPDTGAIRLLIDTGARKNFGRIINDPLKGIKDGILRRYDAFEIGEPYNGDSLHLTEDRVIARGVVQNLHFDTLCDVVDRNSEEAVPLRERIVEGPSRLVSVGFGLNTEGSVVVQGTWSNSRLGSNASELRASAFATSYLQRLEFLSRYYFLSKPSRFHFRPLLSTEHETEEFFETVAFRMDLTPSTSIDRRTWGAIFNFGPTLDLIRTLRGPGVGDAHFTSLMGEVIYRTHDFEYFINSPRSGASHIMRVELSAKDVLSTTTAHRINVRSEALWNLRNLDPPLWVFGVRGMFSTTLTPERTGPNSILPADFLYYLGGTANLRGYGRQELPDAEGALTAAFINFEARLANTLPYGVEPIAFWDLGMMGKDSFSLQNPIFQSPGVGVRWNSPIGVFRSTIARGLTSSLAVKSHWQFYLSYGEEF